MIVAHIEDCDCDDPLCINVCARIACEDGLAALTAPAPLMVKIMAAIARLTDDGKIICTGESDKAKSLINEALEALVK